MNSEKYSFYGEICGFCTIFAQQNRTVMCCVHTKKYITLILK